jgi:hypothetical protein
MVNAPRSSAIVAGQRGHRTALRPNRMADGSVSEQVNDRAIRPATNAQAVRTAPADDLAGIGTIQYDVSDRVTVRADMLADQTAGRVALAYDDMNVTSGQVSHVLIGCHGLVHIDRQHAEPGSQQRAYTWQVTDPEFDRVEFYQRRLSRRWPRRVGT